MAAYTALPEGYREIYQVNMQKDKKIFWLVNGLAVLIAAVLVVPMAFWVPIQTLFDMSQGLGAYALRFGVLLAGSIVYIVLHELTHGIAMKLCGTKKIQYGFTGAFAYAGSKDYYNKKDYILIALAPIVVLGAVLLVIQLLVPVQWFWVIWWIQVSNLSGAAGDLFVSFKFSRMPKDILVQDYGLGMQVFSKEPYHD